MSKKIKRRKRKLWSSRKYWTEYLMNHTGIWLNGQGTISHALASIFIPSPHDNFKSEEQLKKARDKFACFLDGGRLDAIKKLRKAGISITLHRI